MKFTDEQAGMVAEAAEEIWPIERHNTRDLVALLPDILDRAHLMIVPVTSTGSGEGEPDLKPGQYWERPDGSRYLRVRVLAGRGAFAFWHRQQPNGHDVEYQVIADMNDNLQAAHRAGRFSEPFEGKAGAFAWLVMPVRTHV